MGRILDFAQGSVGSFTDAPTINFDLSLNKSWQGILGGNRTITFTNLTANDAGVLKFKAGCHGWPDAHLALQRCAAHRRARLIGGCQRKSP
jgi:hypothetical protein